MDCTLIQLQFSSKFADGVFPEAYVYLYLYIYLQMHTDVTMS